MARATFFRQCTLTRQGETPGSEHQLVTWLPERGNGVDLKPGCTLRISEHGSKELDPERWTVASVGNHRQDEKRVRERAHNWTKYRSATDV